jgi:hypothetical protein
MTVIVEGKLISQYTKEPFKNKDGVVQGEAKHCLQLMSQSKKNGQTRTELLDISMPLSLKDGYANKENQEIKVKCGFFAQNNKVIFYGIDKA